MKVNYRRSCLVALSFLLFFASALAEEYPTARIELANTNIKMPETTVSVYESQIPGYVRFINGRYGYSIDYPSSFSVAFLPANGDGAKFTLPDGSAELSVWGGHSAGWTLEEYYLQQRQSVRDNGGEIGYHSTGNDWFVVTWRQDGKIYYQKVFVTDQYHNGFMISYPEAQKEDYDVIVTNIERTFIPGWKTGYKIRG